jgi:hypothetical protein
MGDICTQWLFHGKSKEQTRLSKVGHANIHMFFATNAMRSIFMQRLFLSFCFLEP